MSNWENIANALWGAILQGVRDQKALGRTGVSIAEQIGVKNRSHITMWLNGERKSDQTSFAKLMEYAENAGLDYRDYFPDAQAKPTPQLPQDGTCGDRIAALEKQNAELEAQVKDLEAQVRALEVYKYKREGHLEAMRAQGSGLVSMPVEKKRSA